LPVSVVVLAAGQGKRMRSDLPKVLQPVAGRPLLAHVLERARELEPAAIYVVYGHGAERVRAAFPDADLGWRLQAEQLGTGHAVAQAMAEIPDEHTVLVLCGDVPLVRRDSLARLLDPAASNGLAILTAALPDPSGYGRIVRDSAGRVVRIVEQKEASPAESAIAEINTGVMSLPAARLRRWLAALRNDNAQREYYLTDVIAMAFAEGVDVLGVQATDPNEVIGINDKLQLAAAERSFQRRAADDLMRRGATIADPARIDVRGRVTLGVDVFIDVGVILSGDVELGDRVRIGPNCVISDSTLGADTIVHACSVIDGAVAGTACELGPFARLRRGTELAERVKIGNFVEVKKSRIARGSKANHLSYLGDATIGADVNIGAGTITCNYDGAQKHETTVGDDAFVGSGVMLVAPVEIGARATIGAGSTVTKDAPAGVLTVARSRQVAVEGWRRPVKKQRTEK
jgi:bifunctional UDP-N-acetylglucosamine pyrophosphorylase / glucosamine-1-phosphate N-acetyltransferase